MNNLIRESVIESFFVEAVKDLGGIAPKFKSPGRINAPDRLAILSHGRVWFVELKAPGEKPNEGQLREHERLRDLGHDVVVLDSKQAVIEWAKTREFELSEY